MKKTAAGILFNTLGKNSEMSLPSEGTKGRIYLSFGIIAVSCIMLPCCIAMGVISNMLTQSMISTEGLVGINGVVNHGALTNGLTSLLHILSAFSMVFSLLVIFNVLFFSADLEYLVTLPFKPVEILRGKFFHTYVAESIMEFLILFSVFVGYFIAAGHRFISLGPGTVVAVIAALCGTVLMPMLPLVYCALVSFILMALLKNVHNKKIFHRFAYIFLMLFIFLFLASFNGLGGISVENYMDSLAGNDNLFMTVCNGIFFTTPILCKAIETGNILFLLLYLALNLAALLIMLTVGSLLYPSCLYAAAALGAKRTQSDIDKKMFRVQSPLVSYLKKEIKTLLRTRAYASNCIWINLLWPIGIFILLFTSGNNATLSYFIELYRDGSYPRAELILIITVIAISFIATAMNSLASTAFTREGQHTDLIKYLPMDLGSQLLAKALIALIPTGLSLIMTILVIAFYIGVSPLTTIYYCALAIVSVILTIVIGLYMDSSAPYTDWSDEYSALRGNLNNFFNMAIAMVIAAFVCALAFLLFEFTPISIAAESIIVLIVLILIDIPAVVIGRKLILKNMEEMY